MNANKSWKKWGDGVAGKDARSQSRRPCRPYQEGEFRYYFVGDGDLLKGFKQGCNVVRDAL